MLSTNYWNNLGSCQPYYSHRPLIKARSEQTILEYAPECCHQLILAESDIERWYLFTEQGCGKLRNPIFVTNKWPCSSAAFTNFRGKSKRHHKRSVACVGRQRSFEQTRTQPSLILQSVRIGAGPEEYIYLFIYIHSTYDESWCRVDWTELKEWQGLIFDGNISPISGHRIRTCRTVERFLPRRYLLIALEPVSMLSGGPSLLFSTVRWKKSK